MEEQWSDMGIPTFNTLNETRLLEPWNHTRLLQKPSQPILTPDETKYETETIIIFMHSVAQFRKFSGKGSLKEKIYTSSKN